MIPVSFRFRLHGEFFPPRFFQSEKHNKGKTEKRENDDDDEGSEDGEQRTYPMTQEELDEDLDRFMHPL